LGSYFSNYNNSFDSQFGYYSVLHVKGIGFKVFYYNRGHSLYFSLGFNHLVKAKLPKSVFVKVRKQYVLLFSSDKQILGQTVHTVRHLRFPDPYRGKGIRFRFQVMKFKPGKQR
jgi:large subunit ribosomal protein L6